MVDPQLHADPAISVSDLSLGYPPHGGAKAFNAIEGVGFEVRRGGVLAVLGESGSGKTTLTRYLAGRGSEPSDKGARILPIGGDATVLGTPLRRLSRRAMTRLRAHLGHLAQDAGATLPADLTVGDILLQPVLERNKNADRETQGQVIAEMMDLVGLPLTTLQSLPFELSKGQRQRIGVMRSLMLHPPVYFADEPTLGVDAVNRPRIVDLLSWYRERTGATMVLVSHDIGVLEALVQDVVVLQQGRLVGSGDINEIFRDAQHGYVRQLAQALRANAYDEVSEE